MIRNDPARAVAGIGGVAAVTALCRWLHVANATTVALSFLLVVLVVAATSRLWVAVATSLAAMVCFNFFFLPPVGTLTIADPQNWIALVAFLAVSLVASNLSSVARTRTHEALARRDEVGRLFDLSRDVLLMTDSREAIALLARLIARRFDLDYVAHLPAGRLGCRLEHFRGRPADADARSRASCRPRSAGRRIDAAGRRAVDGHDGRGSIPLRFGARVGRPAGGGRPRRRVRDA